MELDLLRTKLTNFILMIIIILMFSKHCVCVLVVLKKHIEEHYVNTCSYFKSILC